MKHTTKRILLAFVLVSGIAYPLYAGVVFLSDSLFGDRIILRQLHEARHQLWDTFWADYAHALPIFCLLGVLLFVLPTIVARRYGMHMLWLPPLLGLLGGSGLGFYFSGAIPGWMMMLHGLVGALLGTLFASLAHMQRGA